MFKDRPLWRHLSLPFSLGLSCFSFISSRPCFFFFLSFSLSPSLAYVHVSIQPPHPCCSRPWTLRQPSSPASKRADKSVQLSICSCWYSPPPPDRSTDVCFYPLCLGDKMWHIPPNRNPICNSLCIPVWNYRIDWWKLSLTVELLSFRR